MLKGADTDELAARGDSSASGHQTLLISYHGKTFCYRASDCIDGKPEEENSPNGSYRYTHKKYVCELFLITHIHIIRRGDSSASGHQTLLISYHGKTFCYRASDCIDGKPEEENSPNGSYRYTHKKYVCELFLITHIHIIRGERKASLPLRKVVMQESGYPEPHHFRFADRTNS